MTGGPLHIAADVAQLVEAAGGSYVLGGSLASSLLGEPRSTIDIDIAIHITPANGAELLDAFEAGPYYVPRSDAEEALATAGSFNLLDAGSTYKVDLFVLGDDPLDHGQMARRILIDIPVDPPVRLWVTAAEDQILRKLDWYRRGGYVSERQWRDVIGLLELAGELDVEYLEVTARSAGLIDLLERARSDARQPPS